MKHRRRGTSTQPRDGPFRRRDAPARPSDARDESNESPRSRLKVVGRVIGYAMAALAALGFAALAVQAPVRQLFAQNDRIADVREEIAHLDQTNSALNQRVEDLGEDGTIERLAREELGLVKEGEEAYILVPPGSLGGSESSTPDSEPPLGLPPEDPDAGP